MLCEVLSVFEAHFEIFRSLEYCLGMWRILYENERNEVYLRVEEVARRFDIKFATFRDCIRKIEKSQNELRKPIKLHITRNWAWLQSNIGFNPRFGLNGKGFGT